MLKGIHRQIDKNKLQFKIIIDSLTHNKNNINYITKNNIKSQLIMKPKCYNTNKDNNN